MKLNHLDLQVSDVPASVVYFERVFGLVCTSNRNSPAIAILSDGEGFCFVLQKKKNADERYPDGFHLGFLVEDLATVERVQERARLEGFHASDIIRNGRGEMIYCRAPDGFLVEVSVRSK